MNLRQKLISGIIVGLGSLLASGVAQGTLTSRVNNPQEVVSRQIQDSIDKVVESSYDGSLISFDNPKTVKPDFDLDRLYASFKKYEDVRKIAYDDPRGIRTIGAGFNLEKGGAKERIIKLGLNFNDVYNKKVELTDAQINQLLKEDVDIAIDDAKRYLGDKVWGNVDITAREVIVDVAYVRGYPHLIKFKGVKRALSLEKPDYPRAADELEWENPDAKEKVHTKWYNRTGNRAKELIERMRKLRR